MATACFIGFLGLYVPYFFIQAFAIDNVLVTGNVALYLIPVLNAGSFLGRIVSPANHSPATHLQLPISLLTNDGTDY